MKKVCEEIADGRCALMHVLRSLEGLLHCLPVGPSFYRTNQAVFQSHRIGEPHSQQSSHLDHASVCRSTGCHHFSPLHPAPYPTAATLGPADYLARYWDPTSYSLPLEPFPSVQPPSHRPLSLAKGTTRRQQCIFKNRSCNFSFSLCFRLSSGSSSDLSSLGRSITFFAFTLQHASSLLFPLSCYQI